MKSMVYALAMCLALSACASNVKLDKADKRISAASVTVGDFHGIDVSCGIKVTYTQGSLAPVKVKAPRYILDYVKIRNKNGSLDISIEQSFFKKYNSINGDVEVTLSAPNVDEIETSSGASVSVAGELVVRGDAEVSASSGSSVSIPFGLSATGKVDVDASSAAGVTLGSLKGRRCKIETSSGSGVTVGSLAANRLEVELTSGSGVTLEKVVVKSADFDLSSGSSCTVSGRADALAIDASSGASYEGKAFKTINAKVDASSGASVDFNSRHASMDDNVSASVTNHR